MKETYIFWICLTWLIIGGCEDLKDTYADYAGDGAIRYVGKCSNISVNSGWERLIVKWENSPDVRVKNIKIVWTLDKVSDSVLIEPKLTEYSIDNLKDGNYEVKVLAVDDEGNESLTNPVFARPYTSNHEAILSFTRLLAKHYFVKDRLICFFSTWTDEIESATLEYTKLGENKTSVLELNADLIAERYYLLPDCIDVTKSVVLHRTGRVVGCDDLIRFHDYELSHSKLFTTDFKQLVKVQTGATEIGNEFIENTTVLEIDYTISSLEDILNLPNLQKLVLAKNRYLKPEYLANYKMNSQLYDLDVSLFALDIAHEIMGLTVECYADQFLPLKDIDDNSIFGELRSTCITRFEQPCAVPAKEYLPTKDWKITCMPADDEIWSSFVENLFDGKENTCWQPESMWSARTHEITVDMKELKKVSGVKVVQKSFDPKSDKMSGALLPGLIKVKVSTDNLVWSDATYVEENTIGVTAGEATILNFSSPKDIRYLKFIVNDQQYGSNYSITLADLAVF